MAHELIDAFPAGELDLLPAYCQPIPVIVIARLLGVPDRMAPQLLDWSNAMVAMYQARRTRETEEAASRAASDFSGFLTEYIAARRSDPRDDLLSQLIAAEIPHLRRKDISMIKAAPGSRRKPARFRPAFDASEVPSPLQSRGKAPTRISREESRFLEEMRSATGSASPSSIAR